MNQCEGFCLNSYKPASWAGDLWKEAFPSGNGKVGISVYGAVKKETIIVNHGNLWHWGIRGSLPNVTDAFKSTRNYLRKGKYKEANSLIADALCERGYQSLLYSPCPVGSIQIHMSEEGAVHSYKRTLNMENGEVRVEWKYRNSCFRRRFFVSKAKDIIVFSADAENIMQGISIHMQLHDTGYEDTRRMKKETLVNTFHEGNCLIYLAENEENGHFGMVARALNSPRLNRNKICFQNITDCTILFKVFGDMDASCKTYRDAIGELQKINASYEELLNEHEILHEELFHSVNLQLSEDDSPTSSDIKENLSDCTEGALAEVFHNGISPEFCETLWHYGRYLFISGTAPDAQPFGMYGLWSGRYRLLWSHNMANINLQMMYWHCVTGGYTEYIKSIIDYYYNLIPDLRENASKVFGLNGIFLPAGTTPGYGLMNQVVPVIVNWIGGAGWIAQHMYEYYMATGDEKYLRKKILPFMIEAEKFYEQYLSWDNDTAHIMPSVSPENTPGNLQDEHLLHMSHASPTAKDATMDIAIIKELTNNLISLAKSGKCDDSKLPVWEKILSGLPDYQINKDGAVKEWQSEDLDDFYYHRHQSHIYPLFPGKEILLSHPNDMMEDAFRKAVELRILGGQTGWSLASQACIYARLQEGDKALESLELLAMGCLTSSFFSLHNDWRNMGFTLDLDEFDNDDKCPVQMDANMGIVNAIQEILFQHAPGLIKLLPALPSNWRSGKVVRFGFYGGTVDMEWNIPHKIFKCILYSQTNQELKIIIPGLWPEQKTFFDKSILSETTDNKEVLITVQLKANSLYELISK